jgi:hypothetical protein
MTTEPYNQGRRMGDAYAKAMLDLRSTLQGVTDSINEHTARMRAERAEAQTAPEDINTPERPMDGAPWDALYPMSQTMEGFVSNSSRDEKGRRTITVLVVTDTSDTTAEFFGGMPVTVYGPTPEDTQPPIRVRASTTAWHRKTAVFVDEDKVPPGSLVEVRVIKGPEG